MEYIKIGFDHHLEITAVKVLVFPFLFFKCAFGTSATYSRQRGYLSESNMLSWGSHSGK